MEYEGKGKEEWRVSPKIILCLWRKIWNTYI